MRHWIYRTGLAAVFLLSPLVICAAHGASLELRNGTVFQGNYLGGTSETVNFMVNGKVLQYAVSDIILIDLSSNGVNSNAPTAPPPATAPIAAPAPSSAPSATPAATGAPASPMAPSAPGTAAPAASEPATNVTTGTTAAPGAVPSNPGPTVSNVTVPAGTHLIVRMMTTIDSATNHAGDKFQATLAQPLVIGSGTVVAPKDAMVYGHLTQATQSGKMMGKSELRLELTGIDINNRVIPIVTSDYQLAAKSRSTQTAQRMGIGVGVGALIGAIAAGGKGAAIGAAVGAGGAGALQVMTKGPQVHIPSETELDFTLAQPFTVPAS